MNLKGWKLFFSLTVLVCLPIELSKRAVAEEVVEHVIDYVVFYTPEALKNEEDGSVPAMNARIERAFAQANEIYKESRTGVQLRLVSAVKLSINNSGTSLDSVISELTALPELFEAVRINGADSYALIVEQMLPGAYAGIPISDRQARLGGSTFFGRRNFSGFTFAHETGHTLGAFHDRPDDLSPVLDPLADAPYGNHFIGTSGQHWRTVMSVKLNSYKAETGEILPTLQSNRFSSPNVIWDGVPTGVSGEQDVVGIIRHYAPFVSSAGENRALVPVDNLNPVPVPTPEWDDEDRTNGDKEVETPVEELKPTLLIDDLPVRKGDNIVIKGRCFYSNDGFSATGKSISLIHKRGRRQSLLKELRCKRKGVVTFRISKISYQKGLIIRYKNHPRIKVRVPFKRELLD